MVVGFDLDDTLFPEVDFLKSAERGIAAKLARKYGFDESALLDISSSLSGNAFDEMLAWLKAHAPAATEDIHWMVETYRAHQPTDIALAPDVEDTLSSLAAAGHRLVLVTDGRRGTQRAKIDALGLTRWFAPDDILISEEIGGDKTDGVPFLLILDRYPSLPKMYVGDNPAKDFYWPNHYGWLTVMTRDKGRNIHPQTLDSTDKEHQARIIIDNFKQIINIANGR